MACDGEQVFKKWLLPRVKVTPGKILSKPVPKYLHYHYIITKKKANHSMDMTTNKTKFIFF